MNALSIALLSTLVAESGAFVFVALWLNSKLNETRRSLRMVEESECMASDLAGELDKKYKRLQESYVEQAGSYEALSEKFDALQDEFDALNAEYRGYRLGVHDPHSAAVDKLAKAGVINSPDYWLECLNGKAMPTVETLSALFVKVATKHIDG